MKRLNLLFFVLIMIFVSFGCEKEECTECTTSQKTEFTGKCTPVKEISPGTVEVLPSGKILVTGTSDEWYDSASIALVSGQSFWYGNRIMEADLSSAEFWGTAVINVGVKNEGDPVLGKWELIWEVTLTGGVFDPETGAFSEGIIKGDASGTGVSGNVEGMLGHWTYTMDLSKGDIYYSEGYIIK